MCHAGAASGPRRRKPRFNPESPVMAEQSETADRVIAPVPRITIQAFCELTETAAMIEAAAEDRRLQRARVKVRMGGGAAAIEAFRHAPTPNVIVIEVQGARSKPLECLDALPRSATRAPASW